MRPSTGIATALLTPPALRRGLVRRLRFLSIRARILLLPALALFGLLAYCVWTVLLSQSNTDSLRSFASRTLPVMSLAAQANQGLIETQTLFTQALSDRDEFIIEDAVEQARLTRVRITEIKNRDPGYSSRVNELLGLFDRYVGKSRTAVTSLLSGDGDLAAFEQLSREKQAAYEQIRRALNALSTDSERGFLHAIDETADRQADGLELGILIVVLLSILTLVVSLLVERAIVEPITRLQHTIGQIAEGDFSVRVEDEGDDAISDMCRAFNALLVDLNAAITDISQVAADVGRGDVSRRVTVELKGDLHRLKIACNEGAEGVHRTMQALDSVMDALARGDFSARMSHEVEGESRRKVDRAMSLLQASLDELKRSLSAAAAGELSARIEGDLPGDLNELKQAVNQSLDGLHAAFREIGATAQALREGDLTRRAEGEYSGALGALTQALNESLDSLAAVVQEVAATAEDVTLGAAEIAQGNADLASRTERQAAALETSAASIEELLSTARNAADNSRQTRELTQQALQSSQQGAQIAGSAGRAMGEIAAASSRITDIVALIDSVAFQTNLLALNAAVEAARAGEHGRGFAVVANEVRNLAHSTAASSKEIRGLIASATERVREGTALVNESARQLGVINRSNETIAELSSDAASSAEEQSIGLHQLSRSVEELESVNQQNSTLVEEVAASSAALRARATALRQAVARFRLEPVTTAPETVRQQAPRTPPRLRRVIG